MERQSSTKKQPHNPIFFTDRDLGKIIPDALEEIGIEVVRHDRVFSTPPRDIKWLKFVGDNCFLAFTHDKNIGRKPEQKDMVMIAKVGLFILAGHHPHKILATNLVRTIQKVIKFSENHTPPYIARIYKPSDDKYRRGKAGNVKLWLSHEQWLVDKVK